jgi:5-methylthioadenosine/S-adenosylhomocysteine deaminase
MTQVSDSELELVADAGVSVIHCPQSNLKLGSGHCDIVALQAAGIRVGLGTDGAASNNGLDMFSEMRAAALVAKAVTGDVTAAAAFDTLRMATLGGAEAMSIDDQIGSLEPGKSADLIALDTACTTRRRSLSTLPRAPRSAMCGSRAVRSSPMATR